MIEWLKSKKCPQCRVARLLAGPFYDRWSIRCMECGHKFRLKEREI